MRKKTVRKTLMDIYRRMYAHFGPRGWWPARTEFEVIVGAILTQNTAWTNVEKAIANLKRKRLLTPRKIAFANLNALCALIKPSGFYREKAKKLRRVAEFLLDTAKGNVSKLRSHGVYSLREKFLLINGIGPETADSILLYALGKPVFVVDAYTKRIFRRHGLMPEEATYDEAQMLFSDNLPEDAKLFNEYHALIVETGKNYCKKRKPLCKICPLKHRQT